MYGLEYESLLRALSGYFELRRVGDYAKPAEGKVCLLRHDVDHRLDRALRMAEVEYNLGIRSTYFVLHTADYYGEPGFIERCLTIQGMGHEIGLHNNVVTVALGPPGETFDVILARELAYLRDNGLDVRGTAGHGEKLCHELNYVNYQIFKGCLGKNRPDNVKGIKFYTVDMAEHDLDYEALSIKRDSYLSDSSGVWTWNYPKGPLVQKAEENQDVIAYVNKLGKVENSIILQALTHPVWWAI